MKLGSLFSGSGGFELAGKLCGITPVWASEIDLFAIRVTSKHFPQMRHLGDIRRIAASCIEPVDIITAGFCCQDLSVAGKRDGLKGERSGLFYQIPRIVKGMLRETAGKYPRFVVLENVPGMYISSGGNDFREVLNDLVKIKNETLSVPMPENGKWSTSGEIVGDDFSIAWRTLDAQFWGVPQRRRRCYIVADFAGERAGKILFDESRLPRDFTKGGLPWQKTAGSPAACSGSNVSENITGTSSSQPIVFEPGAASRVGGHVWQGEPTGALRADMGDNQLAVAIENYPGDSRVKIDHSRTVQTLRARMGTGGGNVPLVLQGSMIGREDKNGSLGSGISENVVFTLNTIDRHGVCYQDIVGALCASDYKFPQQQQVEQGKIVVENHQHSGYRKSDTAGTLRSTGGANGGGSESVIVENRYVVRRLTPAECAMLQGFPPDWCAGLEIPSPTAEDIAFWSEVWETYRGIVGTSSKPKTRNQIIKWLQAPHSDSAEYRMWGNGIALPCAVFALNGIIRVTEKE